MAKVTHTRLLQVLRYEPDTGLFYRRIDVRAHKAGSIAGNAKDQASKYVRISIDNKSYLAHQLAWFYMTERWADYVDHKDTANKNNKWENLREATPGQNSGNIKKHSDNKTGYKGVSIRNGKFRAKCKTKDLGLFDSAEEAARAYDQAAVNAYGVFARCNFEIRT